MEGNMKSKNNPFLVGAASNGSSNIKPTTVVTPTVASVTGSPRTRDRNVFITPSANAALSLPLLRGLYEFFFLCYNNACFVSRLATKFVGQW